MRIFHIATVADWDAARASGRYTTSTRGRTLAEEGFVHAARADQWQDVRRRYYADADEPLVLLVIDTERLSAPVVEEAAPGTDERFPHVYGAIEAGAVVQAIPLEDAPDDAGPSATEALTPATQTQQREPHRTFASLFLEEIFVRATVGLIVVVISAVLCFAALAAFGAAAALATILVALVAGFAVAAGYLRRRDRRLHVDPPL